VTCHQSQLNHLSQLICQRIRENSGEEPSVLSSEQRHAAIQPSELPSRLTDNARALGIAFSPEKWISLDDDERYALMKLGGGPHTKRNFRDSAEGIFREIAQSPEAAYRIVTNRIIDSGETSVFSDQIG
jgi:Conserved nitrate reductase-associated protein (Nitr_red_assoc)